MIKRFTETFAKEKVTTICSGTWVEARRLPQYHHKEAFLGHTSYLRLYYSPVTIFFFKFSYGWKCLCPRRKVSPCSRVKQAQLIMR